MKRKAEALKTENSNLFWLLRVLWWPSGGSSCFPVVSGGATVVQVVFRWLPLAQRWSKLFSGGCRWSNGGSSCFPVVAGGPIVVQGVSRCASGLHVDSPECLTFRIQLLASWGTAACFFGVPLLAFRSTTACFSAYFVCLDLFLIIF